MTILLYFILGSGWIVTVIRLLICSVGSDLSVIMQMRQQSKSKKQNKRQHLPSISVLVPAFNEELTIARTLKSIIASDYPKSKAEIIVINDGSKDNTAAIVRQFQKEHKDTFKIRLINRPNKGKARALNYAMKRCAKGRIIMCLDSDTVFNPQALRNAAQYFRNRQTIAVCCYADIIEDGSILALTQRIEYIIGYRIKSANTQFGVNFIIPGTGSAFRRSILKRVNYYESNTLTEDLDLTLKIMTKKRKKEKVVYAADVIASTEAVHNFSALLKQRYRWTYGRAQVFAKYKHLFFSRDRSYDKRLTWGMLPFTLIQDFSFLLSPIATIYFIYYAIAYHYTQFLTGGIIVMTAFLILSVWSVGHLSIRQKLRLSYYAVPMYLLIYLTAFAEYYALIKSLVGFNKLKKSLTAKHVIWQSPERKAAV